jgi:hypothetical protein
MTKKLNSSELELTYSDINEGCSVTIEAKKPFSLFSVYGDDVTNLKKKLEDICDDWVKELGKDVHTQFTLPSCSFTTESIYLTREYSF